MKNTIYRAYVKKDSITEESRIFRNYFEKQSLL